MFSLLIVATSPAVADDAGKAIVEFHTSKPGFTVSRVEGRGVGRSGTATVYATYYNDLCIAPCAVELTPGMHELFGHGNGKFAKNQSFQFQPGTTALEVHPGSSALRVTGRYMSYAGLAALITGATFLAVDTDPDPTFRIAPTSTWAALTAGGAVLTGGGIALSVTNKGKWTVRHHQP